MGKVRIGSGSCAVYLDDAMAEAFQRTLRNLAPRVAERLEDATSELLTRARAGWPVSPDSGEVRKTKSGAPDKRAFRYGQRKNREHSKDLFETGLEYDGDRRVGAYLRNRAPYVYMIKSWQGSLYGQSPWIELIRKPADKLKSRLVKELQADLTKLAKG